MKPASATTSHQGLAQTHRQTREQTRRCEPEARAAAPANHRRYRTTQPVAFLSPAYIQLWAKMNCPDSLDSIPQPLDSVLSSN